MTYSYARISSSDRIPPISIRLERVRVAKKSRNRVIRSKKYEMYY